MTVSEFLNRVDEYRVPQKMSDRKASKDAGAGYDFLRDLRRRGKRVPTMQHALGFERVLSMPKGYLVETIADIEEPEPSEADIKFTNVSVIGDVQAGVWRDAVEFQIDDRFTIPFPEDDRYPGAQLFGLLVKGRSMELEFKPGSIVIAVTFGDIGRGPRDQEMVVVHRRSRESGDLEATLKQFMIDELGRHILWPRSSAPEFQAPIILEDLISGREAEIGTTIGYSSNGDDIFITALVVGAFSRR